MVLLKMDKLANYYLAAMLLKDLCEAQAGTAGLCELRCVRGPAGKHLNETSVDSNRSRRNRSIWLGTRHGLVGRDCFSAFPPNPTGRACVESRSGLCLECHALLGMAASKRSRS